MSVWQKEWAEEQWKSQDKGIWIIGILLKPRFHTVTTTSSMHRFAACPINVEFAFARTWNNWGNELQPDLRHPDRTKDMEMLSQDQIQNIVKMPEGLLPDDLLAALHPNKPGVFEVWAHADRMKSFKGGEKVLVKTNGAWFAASVQLNEGLVGKFTGDGAEILNQVGTIMAQVDEAEVLDHEKGEGVDSDEWSD